MNRGDSCLRACEGMPPNCFRIRVSRWGSPQCLRALRRSDAESIGFWCGCLWFSVLMSTSIISFIVEFGTALESLVHPPWSAIYSRDARKFWRKGHDQHCRACIAEIPALERANFLYQVGVEPGWSRCMAAICVSYVCGFPLQSVRDLMCVCHCWNVLLHCRHDCQQFRDSRKIWCKENDPR